MKSFHRNPRLHLPGQLVTLQCLPASPLRTTYSNAPRASLSPPSPGTSLRLGPVFPTARASTWSSAWGLDTGHRRSGQCGASFPCSSSRTKACCDKAPGGSDGQLSHPEGGRSDSITWARPAAGEATTRSLSSPLPASRGAETLLLLRSLSLRTLGLQQRRAMSQSRGRGLAGSRGRGEPFPLPFARGLSVSQGEEEDRFLTQKNAMLRQVPALNSASQVSEQLRSMHRRSVTTATALETGLEGHSPATVNKDVTRREP